MKGITLPVNVLVIVAIAVIVLLGLVGLYFTGFSPFSQVAGVEGAKNSVCRDLLIAKRCLVGTNTITISNFDANKNGRNDPGPNWNWATGVGDDNLAALCYNYYGARNEPQCKSVCTCVGMGVGGGPGPGPVCDNDGTCDAGEDHNNCPNDCPCDNDGSCEPAQGENNANCPSDCPLVAICDWIESGCCAFIFQQYTCGPPGCIDGACGPPGATTCTFVLC